MFLNKLKFILLIDFKAFAISFIEWSAGFFRIFFLLNFSALIDSK